MRRGIVLGKESALGAREWSRRVALIKSLIYARKKRMLLECRVAKFGWKCQLIFLPFFRGFFCRLFYWSGMLIIPMLFGWLWTYGGGAEGSEGSHIGLQFLIKTTYLVFKTWSKTSRGFTKIVISLLGVREHKKVENRWFRYHAR